MERKTIYQDYNDEMEFIKDGKYKDDVAAEALSPTEVVTVSALERQKAQLEAQKVKVQAQLKELEEKMAQLEAQISRMQAT
jgi:phage shock protein A